MTNKSGYDWQTGYHISTTGEVWSLRKKRCVLLNGYLTRDGYRGYDMKGFARLGHRLVAELYLPNPDNLPIVDHINRVRDDNRLENLRWVSIEENNQNRIFGGTLQQALDFVQAHGYTTIAPA